VTIDWDWSRVVFDQVKIGVRDAEASRTFYRTVLATLDIPPIWQSEHGGQYANLVVSRRTCQNSHFRHTRVARA